MLQYQKYNHILKKNLCIKLNLNHSDEIPKIKSLTFNFNCRIAHQPKNLSYFYLIHFLFLDIVFNRRPKITLTKKNYENLNIRKNTITGCKLDIHGKDSLNYLEKILFLIYNDDSLFLKKKNMNPKTSWTFTKNQLFIKITAINQLFIFNEILNLKQLQNFPFKDLEIIFKFNTNKIENNKLLLSGLKVLE